MARSRARRACGVVDLREILASDPRASAALDELGAVTTVAEKRAWLDRHHALLLPPLEDAEQTAALARWRERNGRLLRETFEREAAKDPVLRALLDDLRACSTLAEADAVYAAYCARRRSEAP